MRCQTPRLWPIVLAMNCVLVVITFAALVFIYVSPDVLMTTSKIKLLLEAHFVIALLLSTLAVFGGGLFGLFRSMITIQRNPREPGLANIANQMGIGIFVPALLNEAGIQARTAFLNSMKIAIIGVGLLLLTAFVVLNTEFGHLSRQPDKEIEVDT